MLNVVLDGVTVITDTMIAIVELILIHLTATCSNTQIQWNGERFSPVSVGISRVNT